MNHVYSLEVPITSYNGKKVFFKQFLFSHKPTKEKVIETCMKILEEAGRFGEFDPEAEEVIELLKGKFIDFPLLTGRLVSTNTFINHPRLGEVPITLSLKKVY